MKKIFLRFIGKEKGSITVFVGISMVILIGMGALVTDLGMAYIKANQLQNAADSSALAAAGLLPLSDGETNKNLVTETAKKYASANGVSSEKLAVTPIIKNGRIVGVNAKADGISNNTLIRVLNNSNNSINMSRQATAMIASIKQIKGSDGILPIGITQNQIDSLPANLNLSIDPGENPGLHYAYIVLDKSNGNDNKLKNWMAEGYSGTVSLGFIPADTGKKNNIDNIYNARYLACTTRHDQSTNGVTVDACPRTEGSQVCTAENHNSDCPRLALVPIISNTITGHGNNVTAEIIGFAQIFVEGVQGSKMTAKFIKYEDVDVVGTSEDGNIGNNDDKLESYIMHLSE